MNYRQLDVWKRSVTLVGRVYQSTKQFPKDEQFGLVSQMRRCAVSIPSNIAEGHARKSKDDFARFLRIAMGSCAELDTQTVVANNLGYLGEAEARYICDECMVIQKMLHKLISSLGT